MRKKKSGVSKNAGVGRVLVSVLVALVDYAVRGSLNVLLSIR
jgi:hypothetical protein